jgi:hypothetical protein
MPAFPCDRRDSDFACQSWAEISGHAAVNCISANFADLAPPRLFLSAIEHNRVDRLALRSMKTADPADEPRLYAQTS